MKPMHALAESPQDASNGQLRKAQERFAAFDLKGIMASVTVLRLRTTDLNLAARQLRTKVVRFPQFFDGAAVVLDLEQMGDKAVDIPLAAMARMMRGCGVVPAGVIGIPPNLRDQMDFSGLPLLKLDTKRPAPPKNGQETLNGPVPQAKLAPDAPTQPQASPPASIRPTVATPPPTPPSNQPQYVYVTRPPLVVREQVRSGQRINARGTDLIVMAPVNPGAELVADGHIHIYGSMRGRAFAGAAGYKEARVFCQSLDAELISIAGIYVMSENIPPAHRNRPVQIFASNGVCHFEAL